MERIDQFRQKQTRLPLRVTNTICGMSMYDSLWEAVSDLFGQRREAATGGKDSLHRFVAERIVPQIPSQSTRQGSEPTLNKLGRVQRR